MPAHATGKVRYMNLLKTYYSTLYMHKNITPTKASVPPQTRAIFERLIATGLANLQRQYAKDLEASL